MKFCTGLALAAILSVVATLSTPARAQTGIALVPHKAIYRISLGTAKSGSGVESVSGDMAAEWSEDCDGWTMDHRSRFDVAFSQSPVLSLESEISTWESRDGLSYHFSVRNKAGDAKSESTIGRAKLKGRGKAGFVEISKPKSARGRLPAGTVFPTDHSVRILEAASRAPTVLSMVVFDGLSDLKPFLINAVIGKSRRAERKAGAGKAGMAALRGRRWWPLQMAFFPHGSNDQTPEQEYGVRFYDNGVGDRLIISFGDFDIRADLVRLEMGKRPACGG